jgi:hypothetical protein
MHDYLEFQKKFLTRWTQLSHSAIQGEQLVRLPVFNGLKSLPTECRSCPWKSRWSQMFNNAWIIWSCDISLQTIKVLALPVPVKETRLKVIEWSDLIPIPNHGIFGAAQTPLKGFQQICWKCFHFEEAVELVEVAATRLSVEGWFTCEICDRWRN